MYIYILSYHIISYHIISYHIICIVYVYNTYTTYIRVCIYIYMTLSMQVCQGVFLHVLGFFNVLFTWDQPMNALGSVWWSTATCQKPLLRKVLPRTSNTRPASAMLICPPTIEQHGGFLKWGYSQIIHFNRIFHEPFTLYPTLWSHHRIHFGNFWNCRRRLWSLPLRWWDGLRCGGSGLSVYRPQRNYAQNHRKKPGSVLNMGNRNCPASGSANYMSIPIGYCT